MVTLLLVGWLLGGGGEQFVSRDNDTPRGKQRLERIEAEIASGELRKYTPSNRERQRAAMHVSFDKVCTYTDNGANLMTVKVRRAGKTDEYEIEFYARGFGSRHILMLSKQVVRPPD